LLLPLSSSVLGSDNFDLMLLLLIMDEINGGAVNGVWKN
jgi:hypothetical protein